MKRSLMAGLVFAALFLATATAKSDEARDALQGVWQAKSVEANGQQAPEEQVKLMQFSFVGDKLFVRGNFRNDRTEECAYSVNAKATPHELDFTTPSKDKVQAIYELNKDELKICIRHATSKAGRPTKFATEEGSELVLIVFEKEK